MGTVLPLPRQTPAPVPGCRLCRSPYRPQFHALRATGMSFIDIVEESKRIGKHGLAVETVARHFRVCLGGETPTIDEEIAQTVADGQKAAATQAELDFAVMVQRRAVELLREGHLRVTAQHGLQAQALLDRRAEKQADRLLRSTWRGSCRGPSR